MKRKYVTSAEMTGWSWVFFSRAPRDVIKNHTLSQPDDPWWFKVPSASWKKVWLQYGNGSISHFIS